ncbi:MAG: penicillin acylase family protein [Chloroflexi bacterium]|nr:penicillin acylase family protein [Chloroflexota bacterium]
MAAPSLRGLGFVAGALGALGAGSLRYVLRRSLPQVDGEVRVAGGLGAPVEIVRDRWGIPHVTGRDHDGALFGLGFCHAQDRLWQMDLNRRVARGELAELVGEAALDVDRLMRRIGLHRAAQREWEGADARIRSALDSYSAGVNAAIEQAAVRKRWPLEYVLLQARPRPWTPLDTLSFGRFFAFTQSANWDSELMRSRIIARIGAAAAAALEPALWQPGSDALPPLGDWGPADLPRPAADDIPPVPTFGGGGSNAWVVSGMRSSTGKPLLASDPHLFPSIPSVFYEAHLVGGSELNAIGVTIPGIPGVAIGHNRDIAWGFTASMADTQDFFVERTDPNDPTRTEYQGRWEPGTVIRESITVKGRSDPWHEDVLVTRHGPVITPTPAIPDEHRHLALQSMVLEAPETAAGLLLLNTATNWAELRAGLSHWGTPSMNCLYADVDGNIGWQLVGRVPVRSRGKGLVPSPGWSGQYEWRGEIPVDELPRAFNPPDGLWANANHEATLGSPHFFTLEYEDPARYHRIREVLESRERHSAVDFRALQADQVSLTGREVATIVVAHLEPRATLEREALNELRLWDGRVSEDSPGAAIYEVFRHELARARFGDALGPLFPAVLGVGPHPVIGPVWSLYFRLSLETVRFLRRWGVARTEHGDGSVGSERPVAEAFARSVQVLRERFGGDVARWQWSRLHSLHLKHGLSIQKPLGVLFDVPAFPLGGDHETVRAAGSLPGGYAAGGPTAGYRFIADTADWDASLGCIPGGQSGHRGSPHYADQVEDWRRVAYHPLAFTRPAISRVSRHTLRLLPSLSVA